MTETTTQPDPQVTAWMREYRRRNPDHRASDAVQAYLDHLSTYSPADALRARHRLAPLVSAWSAGKPSLTVADIPAGQGAASLFIHVRGGNEPTAVRFKAHDERIAPVLALPAYRTVDRALWEHLAATLPTVTDTTEESK